MSKSRQGYLAELINGYWDYQKARFPMQADRFECPSGPESCPPVFLAEAAWQNVIHQPGANQERINELLALVPEGARHKWFRSMSSSQALTQSLFGNLKLNDLIPLLGELHDDDKKNLKLFGEIPLTSEQFQLEYRISGLAEPHPTTLDAYVGAEEYQVAIECKLSEPQFGTCSRPRLKPTDASFAKESCNGNYPSHPMRAERCPLICRGIQYWHNVPYLFNWDRDGYYRPCPLNEKYQLIRTILAAGMSGRSVSARNGHAVIIYDSRNPAFHPGGRGEKAYREAKTALKDPNMLRKCSWQRILHLMREKGVLPWLTEELGLKYGL